MRKLLVGGIAIAAFAAAAVAAILVLTPRGEPPAPPPAVQVEAPAPPPPPPVSIDEAVKLARLEPPPPPPSAKVIQGPPPQAPRRDSWEAVPISPRASALGAVGGAVGRGLNELQPRLAECFDEDAQARFGPAGYTAVRDAAPMNDHGVTILVLQIEASGTQARIVDAPVETRGQASDGLISCAQQVLRGQRFTVLQPQPAARHRMLFSLSR